MHRTHNNALALTQQLAAPTYGVVSRHLLRSHGVDRHKLRRLTARGVVLPHGAHAVRVVGSLWDAQRSPIVAATINSGAAAWADGAAALVLEGLSDHRIDIVDVGVPENAATRPVEGVTRHRFRVPPPLRSSPVLHSEPHHALLRACGWASTDADAASLLHKALEQGIVTPGRVEETLPLLPTLSRRSLIKALLHERLQAGAPLAEVDLRELCRRRGLPPPDVIERAPSSLSMPTLEARWTQDQLTIRLEVYPYPLREETYESINSEWTLARPGDRILHGSLVLERRPPEAFFSRLLGMLHEGEAA